MELKSASYLGLSIYGQFMAVLANLIYGNLIYGSPILCRYFVSADAILPFIELDFDNLVDGQLGLFGVAD